MELNLYDVLLGTHVSTKSLELRKKYGKITFKVNKLANKTMVKAAVEKMYDVGVRDVRILNIKGKTKAVRRKIHQMPDVKKAIVTLKPGYTINLPEQFETMGEKVPSSTIEAEAK